MTTVDLNGIFDSIAGGQLSCFIVTCYLQFIANGHYSTVVLYST